jgi:hypothetical protein
VAVLAVLAHLNALSAGFTFDDWGLVIDNPAVPDGASLATVFASPAATGGAYRPLTIASYRLNPFAGRGPATFHAVNVALHAAAAVLVLALAARLLRSVAAGAAAAALFAVHPVHTEAVTSIAGRAEVLAALGVLLALVFSVRAERADTRHPLAWRVASVISFAGGVFAKENAVTGIALVALVHLRRGGTRSFPRLATLLLPYLAVAAGYVIVRRHVLGAVTIAGLPPFLDNPLAHVDAATRIRTAIVVLGEYLSVLAVPLRLSADESFDQVPAATSMLDPRLVGTLAALALVVVGSVATRRRAPALALGALFAACAMAITANLAFPIGTMKAERLLYLPSVGWCLAAGWLLRRWPRGGGPALALAVLVLALGARTWARNRDWHDDLALFTATAAASPNSARAQQNAGAVCGQAGRLDEAIFHYRRALAIYPSYQSAAAGLALAYTQKGMPEEADRWRAEAAAMPSDDDDLGHALAH